MNHSENFEQLRKQIEVDAKSINLVEISRQFIKVLNRMDELESALAAKQKNPDDVFLDNQEFIQLMNISKRTSQTWRDEGYISYSQVGGKIYFLMSDVKNLLARNYKKAVNNFKLSDISK
jgi:hypothetical protein